MKTYRSTFTEEIRFSPDTEKRESVSPKQVENINKYIENKARGGADALPTGEEDDRLSNNATVKKRVFADI